MSYNKLWQYKEEEKTLQGQQLKRARRQNLNGLQTPASSGNVTITAQS